MTATRRVATVATTVSALLLLGACGSGDDAEPGRSPSPEASASASATPSASASASAAEGVVVDVRLTPDGPEPRGKRVEVKVGEPVTLNVTSEVTDEVHVHSDPEVSIDVQPGDETSRTFTIDRPGQVAVESHETDAVIVQLVVRP
jgi:plastocyanin